MSWSIRGKAQYNYHPDRTRPGGSGELRTPDPKRPRGAGPTRRSRDDRRPPKLFREEG